jgi:uncharacterized membrane protein HdeD (DUF308 family)
MVDKLKSTAFWTTLSLAAGAWLAAIGGLVPTSYAAVIATASVVAYAISRGIAKYNADFKGGYKTTEFWIAAAQVVVIVCTAVPGAVTDKLAAILVASIAAVYTITRGVATPPQEEELMW